MNQRIRKITGQVLDELVPQTWTTLGYDQIKEIQYRTAELIIQKCAIIADREKDKSAGCGYTTKTKGEEILEYFGVEE